MADAPCATTLGQLPTSLDKKRVLDVVPLQVSSPMRVIWLRQLEKTDFFFFFGSSKARRRSTVTFTFKMACEWEAHSHSDIPRSTAPEARTFETFTSQRSRLPS